MKRSAIATVFRKELLEITRDRRTLVVMLVVPVILYPLMALVGVQVTALLQSRLERQTLEVGVAVAAPRLHEALFAATEDKKLRVEEIDAEAAGERVRKGALHAAVIVPAPSVEGAAAKIAIRVLYDSGEVKSVEARSRIKSVIDRVREEEIRARLSRVNLTEEIIRPFDLQEEDLATASRRGAFLFGGFISFMLITMALSASFYAALDLTAGERERGTLETLLVAPIARHEVIAGKYLTVLAVAVTVSVVNIACMGLTFSNLFRGIATANQIEFAVSPRVLFGILLTLLPLAAFFSAVTVGVSTFARSYKEGQNYLTPLFMLAMFPAMLPLFPGIELGLGLAAVPVAGPALLFHKLLLEEAAWLPALVVFGSTLIYAIFALSWATSLYRREEVLFREGDAHPPRIARPRRASALPSPAAAGAMFLIVLAAFGYFCLNVPPDLGLYAQLLLPQLALFLAAPIAVAWWSRNDLRATFSLRPAGARAMIAVPVVTAGAFLIAAWLASFTEDWLGKPQALEEMLRSLTRAAGPLGSVLLIALVPAICEETLCRGYLLAGLRARLHAAAAVLISALCFALLHVDLSRLVTTMAMGAVLAIVVLRSGSIAPAIAIHFLNNALALTLSGAYRDSFPDAPLAHWGSATLALLERLPAAALPVAGGALLAAGLVIMAPRRRAGGTPGTPFAPPVSVR
ncbi:MAG: ABC transporter permease subunit [Planctomycetes bacterium]|nr:ABC transporter permease subunit [Planctomycetota bacterium]